MANHKLFSLIRAMKREMEYQDNKYGKPEDRGLSDYEYWNYAQDEMEESMSDIRDGNFIFARQEALQAMTIIGRWLMTHGIEERSDV